MFYNDEYFSDKDFFINVIEKMNNSSLLNSWHELENSSKMIYFLKLSGRNVNDCT